MPNTQQDRTTEIWAMKSRGITPLFFAILYVLNLSYNLNYFYLRGGAVYDAGWFSWLTSNAISWPMPNPVLIGGNFLSIHTSFIFFLTSLVLHPFNNIPEAVRFAFLFSLWLPIFWLSIFLLVERFWLATLLTFNGLNLAMLGFPHIESFIAPLAFLSLAILFRKRGAIGFSLALIPLCLGLLIREDAGFHVFLLIVALLLCQLIINKNLDRRLMCMAAFALTCSIFALLMQKLVVPSGGDQIGKVYFGSPPFSAVTVHNLLYRLFYWATRRTYIFIPLTIMAITAIFTTRRSSNNQLLLIGIAIALPWLALSLVAATPLAGNLIDYYCFPLLFAFFWPLFLSETLKSPEFLRVQFVMGVTSTLGFILFGVLPFVGNGGLHDRAPWTHLVPPGPSLIEATQAALANHTNSIFDDGAASLIVGKLRPGQFSLNDVFTPEQLSITKSYIRFTTTPPAYIVDQASRLALIFPNCREIRSTRLEICLKQ